MKTKNVFTDDQVLDLLSGVASHVPVPEDVDIRIKSMIRANTVDYVPARRPGFFASRGYFVPAAAALVLAAGAAVALYMNVASPSYAERQSYACVKTMSGQVSMERNGFLSNLSRGFAFGDKAIVTTGADSECLLRVKDGSGIYIGPDSKVEFSSFGPGKSPKVFMKLHSGNVSANVVKLTKASSFEVACASVTAKVRGTEFMVSAGGISEPFVAVLDGSVQVESNSNPSRKVVLTSMERSSFVGSEFVSESLPQKNIEFIRKAKKDVGESAALSLPYGEIIGYSPMDSSPDGNISAVPSAGSFSGVRVTDISDGEYNILQYAFDVPADRKWVSSTIRVSDGDIVEISAAGEVATSASSAKVGPNGEDPSRNAGMNRSAPFGSLVMTPDGGKTVIYIGGSDKYRATSSGELDFAINDLPDAYSDNSGSFSLLVTIKRKK